MGRKGDELRARKNSAKIYHWSREELQAHDKLVRDMALEMNYKDQMKQIETDMQKMFDEKIDEFNSDDNIKNFMSYLQYLNSVSCKILIEHFGWKPQKKFGRKTNLAKYSEILIDEIINITNDKYMNLIKYSEEVYKKYGICFKSEQVEELEEALKG